MDIDPDVRLARVGGGTTSEAVAREATRHGLTPLNGSAPTVDVAGYSLGGGVGPLIRQYEIRNRPRHRVRHSHRVAAPALSRRPNTCRRTELRPLSDSLRSSAVTWSGPPACPTNSPPHCRSRPSPTF
ncbi:hypothetical protein DYI20_04630 [Auritidibacter ignavus]|nr:hypothetical protein DCC27_009375 [Auritidibacter sp. NML130574]PXA79500.1 hypothetical protein DCC26_05395 [Auritidibacter sp. NML120779]PXA80701.1 hypothetical protein DCC25_05665 [Auritidibacter sp. NML120636]RMX23369.1 hypothetical protein DYI20_04630 [Auritidibacter ignavus]